MLSGTIYMTIHVYMCYEYRNYVSIVLCRPHPSAATPSIQNPSLPFCKSNPPPNPTLAPPNRPASRRPNKPSLPATYASRSPLPTPKVYRPLGSCRPGRAGRARSWPGSGSVRRREGKATAKERGVRGVKEVGFWQVQSIRGFG